MSEVEYLPDAGVDGETDSQLRELFTTCFSGSKNDNRFYLERRYYIEPYNHRWIIRGQSGEVVAHAGLHEKRVEAGGVSFPIGGVCEVCVRPDHRGRGYVKLLLGKMHRWMEKEGFAFSVLQGDPAIYASSGYCRVDNLVHGSDEEGWRTLDDAQVYCLSEKPWPGGQVRLPGPPF